MTKLGVGPADAFEPSVGECRPHGRRRLYSEVAGGTGDVAAGAAKKVTAGAASSDDQDAADVEAGTAIVVGADVEAGSAIVVGAGSSDDQDAAAVEANAARSSSIDYFASFNEEAISIFFATFPSGETYRQRINHFKDYFKELMMLNPNSGISLENGLLNYFQDCRKKKKKSI